MAGDPQVKRYATNISHLQYFYNFPPYLGLVLVHSFHHAILVQFYCRFYLTRQIRAAFGGLVVVAMDTRSELFPGNYNFFCIQTANTIRNVLNFFSVLEARNCTFLLSSESFKRVSISHQSLLSLQLFSESGNGRVPGKTCRLYLYANFQLAGGRHNWLVHERHVSDGSHGSQRPLRLVPAE